MLKFKLLKPIATKHKHVHEDGRCNCGCVEPEELNDAPVIFEKEITREDLDKNNENKVIEYVFNLREDIIGNIKEDALIAITNNDSVVYYSPYRVSAIQFDSEDILMDVLVPTLNGAVFLPDEFLK